jgi:hypothetical protein
VGRGGRRRDAAAREPLRAARAGGAAARRRDGVPGAGLACFWFLGLVGWLCVCRGRGLFTSFWPCQ